VEKGIFSKHYKFDESALFFPAKVPCKVVKTWI